MKQRRRKEGQKGFTLIEVIAVLVILGILAAVATPRFFDMQNEARIAAAQGVAASYQSGMAMAFANGLLTGTAITPDATCSNIATNDSNFTIACAPQAALSPGNGPWTITVSGGGLTANETATFTVP